MKKTAHIWMVVLTFTIGVLDAARQRQPKRGAAAAEGRDTAYAAVQARGAMVMGVDQYTSHHAFEELADGGCMACLCRGRRS
jgi:hypothetical protein